MTLFLALFAAGLITILLPCILPLLPIVLGVSVAGRSRWRPLAVIAGMLLSFTGLTFLLQTLLSRFVAFADLLQTSTYAALFLFGVGFAVHKRSWQCVAAAFAGLFFWQSGPLAVALGAVLGVAAMAMGGQVAARIQQAGADAQAAARAEFGADSPLAAFVTGLTLGLVWVPCAGPALGFAFALVRDEPGLRAFLALLSYGAGTAVPLLMVGYGGQAAVHSVRAVSRYSGVIKQVAGVILVVTAVALRLNLLQQLQVSLAGSTSVGQFAERLEQRIIRAVTDDPPFDLESKPDDVMDLPRIVRAPELASDGPWHNSEPLTMAGLRGKVVLIDFWTYSCINCIRTLPYIQGYWQAYKDKNFVIIGVHTPEFVFEKDPGNVRDAIARHGLTYPTVQDNDFGTWRAFANRYWPAKYLIDAEGYVRYTHFGEGAYNETDAAIRALLAEAGVETGTGMAMPVDEPGGRRPQSPETYLGERSWPALANATGEPSAAVIDYASPTSLGLHKYALVGMWQLLDGERQVLRSDTGEIRMRFQGGEINLVMGLEDGAKPGSAEAFIDGKPAERFTIDRDDLYNLYTGDGGEHELVLKVRGAGVEAYAFTFGQ